MKGNLTILMLISLISFSVNTNLEARHPWDCIGFAGDEGNYCRAIYHNDFSFCERIVHEGMKFTCHARTRFDVNICSVITAKKDREYCFRLVQEETKIKNEFATKTIRSIPYTYRQGSAWIYGQ